MGPIALFDKSFLQSLSLDESVWFDHFFLANICPLLFVETLADLAKCVRSGRTPEQEVRIIADRFPEMHGTPNAFHIDLCVGNLMGNPVPMTGQIPLRHGNFVKVDGKTGVVFEKSPENDAVYRWQREEFVEMERLYARFWRARLTTLNLDEISKDLKSLGLNGKSCRSLEDAKKIADSVVRVREKPFDRMKLAMDFLNIPREFHSPILERWSTVNYTPLIDYAPYAAYVITVEVFFQIALAADLISANRVSNRTDIGYLFYLPFCMVFVSSDKLHRRCSSLFLRKDQEFIWGPDLKEGLRQANTASSALPEIVKEKGVMSLGGPPASNTELTKIWDRHLPGWRGRTSQARGGEGNSQADELLLKQFRKEINAPHLSTDEVDFDPEDADFLSVERSVRRRKGSWWQVPKDLKDADEGAG